MESLSELAAFTRAAELGSYVAAARALSLSASAIGKSVQRLESRLGVRLFHRSTRRISLTAEGNVFYQRCLRILDDLQQAQSEVASLSARPHGKLRVSLPVIAYRMLLPVLPAFCARYPDIELDLDFNDRLIDVIAEGVDVVIRSGELVDSRLTTRQLGPFLFQILGAPAYFNRHDRPEQPADLEHHACLHYKFPSTGKLQEWRMNLASGVTAPRLPVNLSCNNIEALIIAAQQGLGLVYLPDFAVREHVLAGHLQPVLTEYTTIGGMFSILWPSSPYLSPKLRVFIDFICANLPLSQT
ncbi:MAG: LysR family transcriptional regulator [Burkholderiales bacterium]|nr:LysR family transcriptional regulator [Burkholderiales bacterium]